MLSESLGIEIEDVEGVYKLEDIRKYTRTLIDCGDLEKSLRESLRRAKGVYGVFKVGNAFIVVKFSVEDDRRDMVSVEPRS